MDDSARLNALMLKVGELERKVDFLMQHLQVQYSEAPLNTAQTEAVKWLRQGNKLEAIKAYRQHTGLGLAEAKTAIDALEQKLNMR